jgi:hypothetical protein
VATDRAAASRGAEKGCAAACAGGEGSGDDGGVRGEEAATRSRAVVRRPTASGHCR